MIECAVHSLRRLGGQAKRVEELIRLLEEYQAKFVQQMIPLSEEIKVDEIVKRAVGYVTRPTATEAVYALATIHRPISVANLIKEVREHNKQYMSRFLFGTTRVTASGKTTARRAPMTEDSEEDSPPFRAEMYQSATLHREIVVKGLIEPARQHIIDAHFVRYEDVASFVWNSPVVPEGRQPFFAQGLLAGFNGDFVVSSHLLVPQVEHMIRAILGTAGHLTAGLDADGIQDEHDLNTTIRHPALPGLLGENLVFDLRSLLVERFGSNLRNELAHGLRSFEAFFTPEACYCWWLVLHVICVTAARRAEKRG